MIIVNYFLQEDGNAEFHLQGVVNDALDIYNDIQPLIDCVENIDFKKTGLFEIYLERATISADPIPEPAFHAFKIIERIVDDQGHVVIELIRM